MKIGLDIHGVINTNPKFFSHLSHIALGKGHEIHIITGSMLTPSKIDELRSYGMLWTNLFSIADYHKELGTPMFFTDPDNPWIEENLWDIAKADYCEKNNISFHIDDTQKYGEYFKTPFGLYDFENNRIDWHFKTELNGAFLLETPSHTFDMIAKSTMSTSAYCA